MTWKKLLALVAVDQNEIRPFLSGRAKIAKMRGDKLISHKLLSDVKQPFNPKNGNVVLDPKDKVILKIETIEGKVKRPLYTVAYEDDLPVVQVLMPRKSFFKRLFRRD